MELKEYDSGGSWHPKLTISLNYGSLEFAGMITGCGLGQIRNLDIFSWDQNKDLTKKELTNKLHSIKHDGVGAILATLGQAHYHNEKRLLELGFELLSEYNNYRHDSSGYYKQRLYILKL